MSQLIVPGERTAELTELRDYPEPKHQEQAERILGMDFMNWIGEQLR
jgi:hypothetical protein